MIHDRRRIENLLHPIRVGCQFVSHVGEAEHVEGGSLVAVGKLFTDQHHVVFRIEHFGQLPGLGVEVARLVANRSFVFAAAVFGRDDDDTVGSPRTVDGTRSGILQYVDGFDVGGIDVVDVAQLQSVNNEQRRVVAIRADSADQN